MKKLMFLVSLIFLLGQLSAKAQNYNKIMGKAIKKAIGDDLKGYQVFSYPTNNFGLITSYEGTVSDYNFLCDMWNCIGVDNPTNVTEDWLRLNDFAAIGVGGTINLTESKQKKVAIKVVLPKIYDIVGISGGLKKEKTSEISINIGKAYLRKLRRDPIVTYINGLDGSAAMKRAYNNGTLVLAVADCVLEDLAVTVKVDDQTEAELDAKIGISGTSSATKIFQDASLSVEVAKNTNGTFSFKVSHPVIFARLIRHQPSGGTLSKNEDFSDWPIVKPNSDPTIILP